MVISVLALLGAAPAFAADTPTIPATVQHVVIDETDLDSAQGIVLQLGLLTVPVDEPALAKLAGGTRVLVAVPGASTPEEAAAVLKKRPEAVTAVEVVAQPGPSVGGHGTVVHNVTVVPFTWEGATPFTRTPEAMGDAARQGLEAWADLGRGAITPGTVTVLDPVVTAPPVPCNFGNYASVAKTALGRGPSGPTEHFLYVPSQGFGCGWAGMAYVPGNELAASKDTFSKTVIAHELGHNFGLGHAMADSCLSVGCPPRSEDEPGTWFEIMGGGQYDYSNVVQARILGAISDADIPLITAPGTYQLTSILENSGVRGLRFDRATGPDAYFEYRPRSDTGIALQDWFGGLLAHRRASSETDRKSMMFDLTPGLAKIGEALQPALLPGNTWQVPGTNLSVRLVSADGTTATVQVTDTTADTQAPAAPSNVTAPVPGSGWITTQELPVTWTPAPTAEEDGVVGYRVTIRNAAGEQWVTSARADQSSVTMTMPAERMWPAGKATVAVQALDAAGNASSDSTLATGIDYTAPGWATIRKPASLGTVYGAQYELTWDTPPETGSGIGKYELLIDGAVVKTVDGDVNSAMLPTPKAGYHTTAVRPIDIAGNVATAYQIAFYSGLVVPKAPVFTSPTAGEIVNDKQVHLTWTQPDEADVASYTLTVDGTEAGSAPAGTDREFTLTLPNGDHDITLTAVNPQGSKSSTPLAVTVRDSSVPQPAAPEGVHIEGSSTGWATSPTFHVSWAPAQSAQADGVTGYRVTVIVADGTQKVVTVPADQTSAPVTLPSGWPLGAMTVKARAFDAAGNSSTSASLASGYDNSPPTWATIRKPASQGTVYGAEYELAWDTPPEQGSGLDHYELLIDGAVVKTVDGDVNSAMLPTPKAGYHTTAVKPYDKAGNTHESYQIAFYSGLVVPKAPAITSPAPAEAVKSGQVRLAWTQADEADVASYKVTVDGAVVASAVPSTDREVTVTLKDGDHDITLTAVNPQGSASAPVSVSVDDPDVQAPAVPVNVTVAEGGGWTNTLTFPVGWTAAQTAEAEGVTGYRITVLAATGQSVVITAAAGDTSATVALPSGWPQGAMITKVVAFDADGDASTAATLAGGYDTTTPGYPNISRPAAWSNVYGATFQLSWATPTETGSGVGSYELLVDGVVVKTVPGDVNSTTMPTPKPKSGTYNTTAVRAVDKAGNVGSAYQIGIYSQLAAAKAPVITSPTPRQYLTSNQVHLSWTQASPADVASYTLIVDGTEVTPAPVPTDTERTLTLADGDHTIVLTAVNAAGSASASVSVIVGRPDTTAPATVTITAPADGATVTGAAFEAAWDTPAETGSGLDRYELVIDGSVVKTVAAGTNTTTLTTPATGSHTLAVRAYDRAGNANSATTSPITFTTELVNRALTKPVTASSTYSATYTASKAVDGNTSTRWASVSGVDLVWTQVDLGAAVPISRVLLRWETAYGKAYKIQTSDDGTTWTDIYSTTTGDGGIDDLTGLTGSGRYLRMYATTRGTKYGYSLYELEAYS